MSDIDFQDTWRENYASFSCMVHLGLPAQHDWLAFCCLGVLDTSPQKPLWKIFIKTRLAFSEDRIALLFRFDQMTLLKTKPSLAPPALLKNSTMCHSPTDVPGDTAGSLSSRCIVFVQLHADISRVEQTESWSRHSSVNTYKSAGIVSWSPRQVSAVNRRWCLRCFHTFPSVALPTDSVISRLPNSAPFLFVKEPIMRNLTLRHNCTNCSSVRTAGELWYIRLISAFLHSQLLSGRQRQGGVMDLSKASCHMVAFRREMIPLGRSWQSFPWSRTGLKIVCTSREVKSWNAAFSFWQTRTRKTAWSKSNSLKNYFSDSFWMRDWGVWKRYQ